MGSLDELNAAIGLALATRDSPPPIAISLRQIQNDLFDAGAELCFPPSADNTPSESNRSGIRIDDVERLERLLDQASQPLPPLNSFILPGGSSLSATLHLARTVCRRAEREVLALAQSEKVSLPVRMYLNRLSDLLFVYARLANDTGRSDVLWEPGGSGASTTGEH